MEELSRYLNTGTIITLHSSKVAYSVINFHLHSVSQIILEAYSSRIIDSPNIF